MAIARTKENPSLNNSDEIVFREVVKDEKDIQRKVDKLRSSCLNYGPEKFRLYISVNARNVMDAHFNFRGTMDDWLQHRFNGHEESTRKFKRVDSHWKSELQKPAAVTRRTLSGISTTLPTRRKPSSSISSRNTLRF
ncbi:hypothetical protein SAMN05443574_103262 [Haloarcula vallismortis]|uniref:Uncharacterized protein n=2 Tax=Haloarcula vallismortis TaxID=28442 RepID=M0JT76_HALVA|nr:hypothetical protein C437_01560 [Haloarcula vallismortis ATCC 29715]SDW44585.1 hypothetical protein SAMN05443574_103262 [Haloarcula vallismortis]